MFAIECDSSCIKIQRVKLKLVMLKWRNKAIYFDNIQTANQIKYCYGKLNQILRRSIGLQSHSVL